MEEWTEQHKEIMEDLSQRLRDVTGVTNINHLRLADPIPKLICKKLGITIKALKRLMTKKSLPYPTMLPRMFKLLEDIKLTQDISKEMAAGIRNQIAYNKMKDDIGRILPPKMLSDRQLKEG